MKLSKEMIKTKKFVGTTGEGMPVLLIETHGGLYACFAQTKKGEVETLAASPHKAITFFLAEKKDPGLKWKESLDELVKSKEASISESFRNLIFQPTKPVKKSNNVYIIYDVDSGFTALGDIKDIKEAYKNKELDESFLLRKSDLSEEPIFIGDFDFDILDKE